MCQRSVSNVAPSWPSTSIIGKLLLYGCFWVGMVTLISVSSPRASSGTFTSSPAAWYSETDATLAARASDTEPEAGPRSGATVSPETSASDSFLTRTVTVRGLPEGTVAGASISESFSP